MVLNGIAKNQVWLPMSEGGWP